MHGYGFNNPVLNYNHLIFNYNRMCSDSNVDTQPSTACDCATFCYKPAGHVITGNLNIISDKRLISALISKGPKYQL